MTFIKEISHFPTSIKFNFLLYKTTSQTFADLWAIFDRNQYMSEIG